MKNLLLFLTLLTSTNLVQSQSTGTMTDSRDGQTYRTVTYDIDGKSITWMAENLNYEMDKSYAYNNDKANREKYGLLYSWEAAINACPDKWRLPSREEGQALINPFIDNVGSILALLDKGEITNDNNTVVRNGFNARFGGFAPRLDRFQQIGETTAFLIYGMKNRSDSKYVLILNGEVLPNITGGFNMGAAYCRCIKK